MTRFIRVLRRLAGALAARSVPILRSPRALAFAAVALVVIGALLAAEIAAAAPDPQAAPGSPADNTRRFLVSWGRGILLAIVGFAGLVAVVRRDVGQALALLLLAVVVGAFFYAQDAVTLVITSVWDTIAGS